MQDDYERNYLRMLNLAVKLVKLSHNRKNIAIKLGKQPEARFPCSYTCSCIINLETQPRNISRLYPALRATKDDHPEEQCRQTRC